MKTNLELLDATAQAELVESGELSALELVDAAISRIEASEPRIHALAAVDFEAARERARDQLSGPFAGVPFLVKDLIAYPGLRHSMGSRLFAANIAKEGTPYSDRLDAAGLVVLGKSTTSELGILGSTETLLEGTTKNPWDVSLSAGGSSGGSAAAVAAGMVPMAHASDGGGSIRIPAALNGLFGFKPGGGNIAPSAPDDMYGLLIDHCVSWSVRDSARLLASTASEDGLVEFVSGPSRARLRIGVYRETLMGALPSEAVGRALDSAVALCRDLGHQVFETPPPPIEGRALSEAFFTAAGAKLSGLSQMMSSMLGRPIGEEALEPFTLELIDWYRSLPADAEAVALAAIERAGKQMQAYAQVFDVLLCPTIPDEPHPLGTLAPSVGRETLVRRTERLAGYTPIHNMARMPAMSVPLAMSDRGLPIGMHFAAARGGEGTLLSLAYELEEAAPWRDRRPIR